MRIRSKHVSQLVCIAATVTAAQVVRANSGIQIPLNQYQAGSEVVTPGPVVNGNFEAAGPVDGNNQHPNPDGWIRVSEMFAATPYNPPANAAAVGSFAAQTVTQNGSSPWIYAQQLDPTYFSARPHETFILSAYIWNSGRPDPNPSNINDLGDLATVKIIDPADAINHNVSITLEANGADGATASTGRLAYLSFSSDQIANWSGGVELDLISETNQATGPLAAIWAQYDNINITTASQFVAQKWNSNSSGNWGDGTKWLGGQANHSGAVASFTNGITSPQTVTVDAGKVVGIINFDNANRYTIAGSSTITLGVDVNSFIPGELYGTPGINVLSGSHTISAPVSFAQAAARLNVVPANSTLTVSGAINYQTSTVVQKIGAGRANLSIVKAKTLQIDTGTVGILSGGNASKVGTLTIAGSTGAWTSTLDLNNGMIVDYTGASVLATVADQVKKGFNSGAWNGTGIDSSSAAAIAANAGNSNKTGVGFAEGSAVLGGATTFMGQPVDATAVLMRYTYYGDSNLSGNVDSLDFNALASNFGLSGKSWVDGDYNFDGKVDSLDFNGLASNFGLTIPAALSSAVVPEPTALALVLAPAALAMARRRRR